MKGIYAIYDTKAQDILGPPTLFAHAAPAVRWFGDVATLPDSQVGKHIQDFELVRLGYYDLDLEADKPFIDPDFEVILTGTAWKAAQDNSAPPSGWQDTQLLDGATLRRRVPDTQGNPSP